MIQGSPPLPGGIIGHLGYVLDGDGCDSESGIVAQFTSRQLKTYAYDHVRCSTCSCPRENLKLVATPSPNHRLIPAYNWAPQSYSHPKLAVDSCRAVFELLCAQQLQLKDESEFQVFLSQIFVRAHRGNGNFVRVIVAGGGCRTMFGCLFGCLGCCLRHVCPRYFVAVVPYYVVVLDFASQRYASALSASPRYMTSYELEIVETAFKLLDPALSDTS